VCAWRVCVACIFAVSAAPGTCLCPASPCLSAVCSTYRVCPPPLCLLCARVLIGHRHDRSRRASSRAASAKRRTCACSSSRFSWVARRATVRSWWSAAIRHVSSESSRMPLLSLSARSRRQFRAVQTGRPAVPHPEPHQTALNRKHFRAVRPSRSAVPNRSESHQTALTAPRWLKAAFHCWRVMGASSAWLATFSCSLSWPIAVVALQRARC
jgi:hypothetical protein